MKNIHVLTTTGASRLKRNFKDSYSLSTTALHWREACYIYITSDQIVEKVDWCIDKFGQKWKLEDRKLKAFTNEGRCIASTDNITGHECKKIILTNDPKLIAWGVQEVDEEFLGWFVSNPATVCVKVKDITTIMALRLGSPNGHLMYKIEPTPVVKDLTYWEKNCEEDYLHTPISVLRYISELEEAVEKVHSDEDLVKFMQFIVSQESLNNTSSVSETTAMYYIEQFKKK